ncbi:MAG: SprT protein [Gammaproteobacteria bacterium]|jgi:SprT protein
MALVLPIDSRQQEQVIEATVACLERAKDLFERDFVHIPVRFDLKGRAAGMFKVSGKQSVIRYNPYIFAKFFDENLRQTVPHEVAHYVTHEMHSLKRHFALRHSHVRPHGKEWQDVMFKLGADPSRTCNFDMTGIPVRVYSYHLYVCDCRQHQLGSRRHNRVFRRQANYHCRLCGSLLRQTA